MGQQFSQFFPPAPAFTETSLPNLSGKVYIVTGASAGIGKELSRLLYTHNATVYLAGRSAEKTHAAISWIKEACPESKGNLQYLHLDLDDLSGIKASAESFLAKESRLDVLFNNAGVMVPPAGSTTKQGYELQLGTNCVAPFLFTKLLTPVLLETAKKEAKGSVRVIWVSSIASQMSAPPGGVDMSNLEYTKNVNNWTKYGMSKGGNVFHALEYQRKYGGEGIVSLALNPGNLKSELARNMNPLFAGLAPEAAKLKEGEWVIPWGRVGTLKKEYWSEAGNKTARAFWEWSEKQVEQYA
ncbi:hypothetical protein J4E93_004832 [Alternaria ventricosa]|uniref:uncharacterized protein n=1 Tax=Alternaria ventricosa TaxID=1187951 RepID=UPI0020C28AD6|nr:uncharacterized protein J4E93_004832 [Alternaria ventricosa]KAI4646611.1 hypothetical protein J4E93_004832 [Alternaria ventricosa]